jgi:CheY-like chemotaxis protein
MSEPPQTVVLVVEDEPLVRLLVSEVLSDTGFKVVEAANAGEALTILQAGIEVHVLYADVDMPPGINGYELAQQVHRDWPGIEILITSGRAWPGQGDLPAGAAFLAKPVPIEAMASHVQSAADRAQAARLVGGGSGENAVVVDGNVVPFPKTA